MYRVESMKNCKNWRENKVHHAKNLHVWFYTLHTVYIILTFSTRFILAVFLTNPSAQLSVSTASTLLRMTRINSFVNYMLIIGMS